MQVAAYTETVIEKSAGFQFETIDFGLASPAVVFDILCNMMYQNPLRTMVQEYMANARDAHREIGVPDKPITVTLPTAIDPNLRIRDYGPGITPERMEDVFVLLGASTKREDDVQTGGFGIGAKVGWAYSKAFIVESFVDGIVREYIAFLGEKNTGQLSLTREEPTDDPNGVEIRIRVNDSDFNKVRNAVEYVSYFWDVAPTVYNTSEDIAHYKGTKKEPQVVSVPHVSSGSCLAVVDGIPYTIDMGQVKKFSEIHIPFNSRNTPCLFFDVGQVEVGVNREGLRYSDKTQAAINTQIDQAMAVVDDKVKAVTHATSLSAKITALEGVCSGFTKDNQVIAPLFEDIDYMFLKGLRQHHGLSLSLAFNTVGKPDVPPLQKLKCNYASELVSKVRIKQGSISSQGSVSFELNSMSRTYIWFMKSPSAQPSKAKILSAMEASSDTYRTYYIIAVRSRRLYRRLKSMGIKCFEDLQESMSTVAATTFLDTEVKNIFRRSSTMLLTNLDATKHYWCTFKECEDARHTMSSIFGTDSAHSRIKCFYVVAEQVESIKQSGIKHYKQAAHERITSYRNRVYEVYKKSKTAYADALVSGKDIDWVSVCERLYVSNVSDTQLIQYMRLNGRITEPLLDDLRKLTMEYHVLTGHDFNLARKICSSAVRTGPRKKERFARKVLNRKEEISKDIGIAYNLLMQKYPLLSYVSLSQYQIRQNNNAKVLEELAVYMRAKNGDC